MHTKYEEENLMEGSHLGDLGIDELILLQEILEESSDTHFPLNVSIYMVRLTGIILYCLVIPVHNFYYHRF
jgi:hypothetical protein